MFSPLDERTIVAGGYDSGVFLSTDIGATWTTLTDNSGGPSNPVVPRPRTAHFEVDGTQQRMSYVYVGTQGRGAWRIGYAQATVPLNACAEACKAERDDCMREVARPGGPRPAQCVAMLNACLRNCN
jgi:hypothetical protein